MNSIRVLFFNYFFVTIVVVFGVLTGFLYYSSTQFLEANIVSDHKIILENITKNVSAQYLGRLKSLENLAFDLQDIQKSPENIRKIKSFLKYDTLISSVHVYDLKGDLVLAEKKEFVPAYNVGKNIYENNEQFAGLALRAIKTKESVLSPMFLTRYKNVYQTYIVPLMNSDQHVVGIISGAVFPFLTNLKYTVEGLSVGEGNVFILASKTGYIVTQSEDKGDGLKDSVRDLIENPDAAKGVEQDLSYFVLRKQDPATENNFLLFVDKKNLIEKKERMFNSAIIAYVLSLLLGLLVSTFISNKLAKPINKLHSVLLKMNSGDFTARTRIKGKDVLSQLCQECDLLCKNIDKDKFIARLWSGKNKEL
jgi:hypothetical protein